MIFRSKVVRIGRIAPDPFDSGIVNYPVHLFVRNDQVAIGPSRSPSFQPKFFKGDGALLYTS